MAAEKSVVIVTGAASGIGLAMATGLIDAGHDVMGVDRNGGALEALAGSAAGKRGRVATMACDLTQADSAAQIVSTTLAKFGRVDALVNNAGIGQAALRQGQRGGIPFLETTAEQWSRFVAVHATAPINLARAAVPHMLAARRGRVITVTTSLGTMMRPGYLLYGASKAAEEAAMAVLAAELAGSGVTSNVLVPGGVTDTPLVGELADRSKALRPGIMVAPLLWLISDEANDVNARRFVAADWDASLPPKQAAQKAGVPIAWGDIARMPIEA